MYKKKIVYILSIMFITIFLYSIKKDHDKQLERIEEKVKILEEDIRNLENSSIEEMERERNDYEMSIRYID